MDQMTYIVRYLNYIDFIMIKTFANKFRDANEAFEYWYQCIEHYGQDFAGTKALDSAGWNRFAGIEGLKLSRVILFSGFMPMDVYIWRRSFGIVLLDSCLIYSFCLILLDACLHSLDLLDPLEST